MELSHIRVIGSGLIGGSIGLGLVQRGLYVEIVDVDPTAAQLAKDLLAGATELSKPSDEPDLIVIATPLGAISSVLKEQMNSSVKYGFMDVASVKTKVLQDVLSSGLSRDRFLLSHPMAGREVGGAHSARADLFVSRPWLIDPTDTSSDLISAGRALIELLGATPIIVDSNDHDQAVALVSHLPQVISSLLAKQLNSAQPQWLSLAGAGLRDTVRIAGSSPSLWKEIISFNCGALAPFLQSFIKDAQALLDHLSDEAFVEELIKDGNNGREQIPGKHGGRARNYSYLPIVIEDKPGQLAALFDECANAGVNVEDLAIEHSPGQFTGLITLALSHDDSAKLSQHLANRGWNVHAAR